MSESERVSRGDMNHCAGFETYLIRVGKEEDPARLPAPGGPPALRIADAEDALAIRTPLVGIVRVLSQIRYALRGAALANVFRHRRGKVLHCRW